MSVTEEIFKSIDIAINEKTNKLFNTDVAGIIEEAMDNGIYKVSIDKHTYQVPNGSGIAYKSGDLVWIHCPNGDFNRKFIIGRRAGRNKVYTSDSSGEYGGGSSVTSQDIITNAEIDAMFA